MSSQPTTNVETRIRFCTFITASGAQFEVDLDNVLFRRLKPNKAKKEPPWHEYTDLYVELGACARITLRKTGTTMRSRKVVAMLPRNDHPHQQLLL